MRLIAILIVFGLLPAAFGVDALLITEEGESMIGHNVVKKGNIITYTSRAGKRESVEVAQLYQILPKVKRGQKYDPKIVNKYIKYGRRARRDYPKLRKQIQALLDEWLAVRRQFKELTPEARAKMEAQIKTMFTEYEKSEKTDGDFNRLRSEMEMLQYKDLQGVFDDLIRDRMQQLAVEYARRNIDELKKMAAKKSISLAAFAQIEKTSKDLLAYNPPEEMERDIKDAVKQARRKCLMAEVRRVAKFFGKNKSLEGYLRANDQVNKLRQQVAERSDYSSLDRIRTQMQSALGGYDFKMRGLQDFPLTREDKDILQGVRPWVSSRTRPLAEPAAIIFPKKFMMKLDMRSNERVDIRAVFGRTPPNASLGLFILPYEMVITCNAKVKNAHSDLFFSMPTLRKALKALNKSDMRTDEIKVFLVEMDGTDVGEALSNPIRFKVR